MSNTPVTFQETQELITAQQGANAFTWTYFIRGYATAQGIIRLVPFLFTGVGSLDLFFV
jgi:hypothetical protein